MSKKTISIPATIGSNAISETFGKINLSPEVKDFLSALNAEMYVRYNPGAEKPIIAIVGSDNKLVCSFDEFKQLSGYRRWVNDTLKELDKETSTNEKVQIISFYLRKARAAEIAPPEQILEANYTKFNNIGVTLQTISKHLEAIENTMANEWKDYVVHQIGTIVKVLHTTQMMCVGPERVDSDHIEKELFVCGVPKWLYTKLSDKSYTNNLKRDCMTLLFPTSNYLKSISLTTEELSSEPFITANKIIAAKSGSIIAMSRTDWKFLIQDCPENITEDLDTFIKKYQWTMIGPHEPKEVLRMRLTGKAPPVFRPALKPKDKKTGGNRPETELQRISREFSNAIGVLQSTWIGIMNFVIPVANPKTEFWQVLYPNASNWVVTPTNTLYQCIEAEGNTYPLTMLRDMSSEIILERVQEIILAQMVIPHGSNDAMVIKTLFDAMLNKPNFVEMEPFDDGPIRFHTIENLVELITSPPTPAELAGAQKFLGISKKVTKTKKKGGASAIRLHTSVLNELSVIENSNPHLHEKVKQWIASTFKTGIKESVQLLAAQRVVGEALKHQTEIFGEEFDEAYALEELEEYYDDEE